MWRESQQTGLDEEGVSRSDRMVAACLRSVSLLWFTMLLYNLECLLLVVGRSLCVPLVGLVCLGILCGWLAPKFFLLVIVGGTRAGLLLLATTCMPVAWLVFIFFLGTCCSSFSFRVVVVVVVVLFVLPQPACLPASSLL